MRNIILPNCLKKKRGLHECRQKGTFTGGNLLYGYRIENKRIVVDPEEAENVSFVFEQYALGRTVREIMEMLNERGVLWKGRPFTRCTVYHMLTREHYIGIYRVNGEVLLNTYPAIVPKPLFEEVRAKLAKNQKGSSSARNLFLLKGKLNAVIADVPSMERAGLRRRVTAATITSAPIENSTVKRAN